MVGMINTAFLNFLRWPDPKPEPEKTCKDCEPYEFYDGPEKALDGRKAIMFCSKLKGVGNNKNGLHGDTKCCGHDGYFTPKKPEPKKSAKKSCTECTTFARRWGLGIGQLESCKNCLANDYSQFTPKKPEPIPEKKEPEPEKPIKPKPNNSKENKMFKILRRLIVLSVVVHLVQIGIWANPQVFRAASFVKPVFRTVETREVARGENGRAITTEDGFLSHVTKVVPWNPKSPLQISLLWSLVAAACGLLVAAGYGYDRFVARLWGETK